MEVDENAVEATPEDKGEVSSEEKVDEDVVEVSSEDKEAASTPLVSRKISELKTPANSRTPEPASSAR